MSSDIKPAICCVGYNRPNSMKRLLSSVVNACYDDNDITLIISIDESPNSNKVEEVARSFEWRYGLKKIIRYPTQLGLKEHCLRCGDLALEYGAVIFLEDDVVVAPGFYRYTKAAVAKYKDNPDVFCISLYYDNWFSTYHVDFKPAFNGFDTFFAIFEESHGQCWMANGWKEFREWLKEHPNTDNVYNKDVGLSVYKWNPTKSWSRFVCFFITEKRKFYVLPYHSYATNMTDVGVHAAVSTDISQTALSEDTMTEFRFGDLDNSVVYDSHAERMDKFVDSVAGIAIEEICLDLNGAKYDWEGYKYLLTSKKLPYDAIAQFGINMEPIENNIRYNVPGNTLTLYLVPDDYRANKSVDSIPPYTISRKRLEHIYYKVPLKYLLYILRKKIARFIGYKIKRF